MIGARLYVDPIDVLTRPAPTAGYGGRDEFNWATASVRSVQGVFQPETSTEDTEDRQVVVSRWRLFLPPDVAIRAVDRVRYAGASYEVDGDPEVWKHRGQPDHVEVLVRRVTG